MIRRKYFEKLHDVWRTEMSKENTRLKNKIIFSKVMITTDHENIVVTSETSNMFSFEIIRFLPYCFYYYMISFDFDILLIYIWPFSLNSKNNLFFFHFYPFLLFPSKYNQMITTVFLTMTRDVKIEDR